MITKVHISDNENTPIGYLDESDVFKNGAEFDFIPGTNVIVGPNGSGKSTLIDLIRAYTLVNHRDCEVSNATLSKTFRDYILGNRDMNDGVDVYGDYATNIFRMVRTEESRLAGNSLRSFLDFGATFESMNSSTGEGMMSDIEAMFSYMFDPNRNLSFPLEQVKAYSSSLDGKYDKYVSYVENHKVDCDKRYTMLMDEPERNLDIYNIDKVMGILGYDRGDTQIICTIHNPLVIYELSKNESINFIELKEGYVNDVIDKLDEIIVKK